MPDNCPACKSKLKDYSESRHIDGLLGAFYSCPQCGDFLLSGTTQAILQGKLDNPEKVAIFSHAIRKMQREGKPPFIDSNLLDHILRRRLPSLVEQANNLILWIGETILGPGERILVQSSTHQAIIGAKTSNGFSLVLEHLFEDGLLEGEISKAIGQPKQATATLSFKGWKYFDDIKKGAISSRIAFMAMKYGDAELDKIVDDYFKPAVDETGFTLQRLIDKPKAELIDDRLRVDIRTSRFLIADLTHENAGAYWEAGFAEGLGKPVIYTCEADKFNKDKTHFDTNHHLTVAWDKNKPEEAAEELKATIRATLPDEAKLTDDKT